VFRHYWILAKFLINVLGTVGLLMFLLLFGSVVAVVMTSSGADVGELRCPSPLVHASVALLVLLAATMLSVYKPRGVTPYGCRKQHERRTALQRKKQHQQHALSQPEQTLAKHPHVPRSGVHHSRAQEIGQFAVAGVSPLALDFGAQVLGTTSAAQSVTVHNTSQADLAIFGAYLDATGDFMATTSDCFVEAIAPGDSRTLDVRFMPQATGSATGTLYIYDNAADSPQMVFLNGTGTLPATDTPEPSGTTPTPAPVPPTATPINAPVPLGATPGTGVLRYGHAAHAPHHPAAADHGHAAPSCRRQSPHDHAAHRSTRAGQHLSGGGHDPRHRHGSGDAAPPRPPGRRAVSAAGDGDG
jgi:hypothetical protein